ncbi:hypothetical protein B0H13DRAFT_2359425 [Mycena leptocephala]|nr:hypothetical protein B0H13DRAFT_2359425 [Mycena leptocephala]
MHPALQFQTLEKLPLSLPASFSIAYPTLISQRHAIPAYHGSLQQLAQMVKSLKQNFNAHNLLCFTVFHANLRLSQSLPPAGAAPAPETFLITADMVRNTSMEGVVLFGTLPEGVLAEFWPRFWHWFQIMDHRRASPSP